YPHRLAAREEKSVAQKVAGQFSAVGSNGLRELLAVRTHMRRLEAAVGGHARFSPEGLQTDTRILDYLSRYRWHNTMEGRPGPECVGTGESDLHGDAR
ncbi:MAG: hypothetical protein JXA71_07490, partial [Chitinispirillaceae bacterium]|nr:hypothetical protein [Chitinispirillaceae bacterium]